MNVFWVLGRVCKNLRANPHLWYIWPYSVLGGRGQEVLNPLKMYGLYLEAVNDYINESYGEDVWRLIEARAEIPHLKFVRHQMYK